MTHLVTVGTVACSVFLVLVSSGAAQAQPGTRDVAVTAPTPTTEPPRLGLEPALLPAPEGTPEPDLPRARVRTRHAPAFVTPFVGTIPVSRSAAVRVGISGWTAPAVPFDIPQASGGVAFGLTLIWGFPVAEAARAEPEVTEQR